MAATRSCVESAHRLGESEGEGEGGGGVERETSST